VICILGLDIGGANVKTAGLEYENGETRSLRAANFPLEIWREKERLPEILQAALKSVFPGEKPQAAAVTMTAELSDVFASKREGVSFVLDSLAASYPGIEPFILSLQGEFIPLEAARQRPLDFAASNWLATALLVGQTHADCLLIDVGTTTTDIIPILGGRVAARGRTDLDRLTAGELVYTGALRTNLAAIVQAVPIRGAPCRVSSEYFAISGDVHRILGCLPESEYSCPMPDGRDASIESARGRLARLVCADREMLTDAEIDEMAHYIYDRQVDQISEGIRQVFSRIPGGRGLPALAAGSGAFLALEAGRRLGLTVSDLSASWGAAGSAAAPSLAAAVLFAGTVSERRGAGHG
jgi:(4-(4-[2-(gamma-L-glutamylamino)ethyl]phenoxymethyl)furan-2-yl)methanamine synthase